MKLRSHLSILVVTALLPLLIFACVMIVVFGRQQQRFVEKGLLDTARALSLTVDREVRAWSDILDTLATSEYLDSGGLRSFYNQARRAVEIHKGLDTIILADPARRQLLNVRRPFGSPLPKIRDSDQFKRVIETRRPVVSDLFSGQVLGKPLLGMAVPVIRAGKVRYVLMSAASPAFLSKLLLQQKPSGEWEAGVIDKNKIIIARTRNIEEFLGRSAGPVFAAKSKESEEAVWRGAMQEGPEVYSALHRSELSGWTVVVGIHAPTLDAPLRYNLAAVIGGGFALLLLGTVLASLIGRRIANSIAALSGSATAVERSESRKIVASQIVEVNEVARALEKAAAVRDRSEEALRESRERMAGIIESAMDGIISVDSDQRIILFNAAAEKMFQWTATELIGKSLDRLIPERLRTAHREHIRIFAEAGVTTRRIGALGIVTGLRANGEEFPIEASISQTETDGHKVFTVILRDIAERKRAEEEVQRNLDRIRALHEINKAITSTLDLRTVLNVLLEQVELFLPHFAATIRLFNKKSQQLEIAASRNISEEEWKEHISDPKHSPSHSWTVFHSRKPLAVRNVGTDPDIQHSGFLLKQGLISFLGVPLVAKDEALGVLTLYAKEEREFTGEEIEFLMTIASQAAIAINNAQLYEEMEKANKVKNEFLSMMSHELRTPLNVVVGYSGMMKDGMLGEVNPQQQEALEKVIRRTNDQLALVNNILYATVLDSESVAVDIQDFNMEDFLNQLKLSYEAPINKDLTLDWDYPFGLPIIRTDSAKLKHILQNLIDNALKFTGKGSVTISARITEGDRQQAVGNRKGGVVEFKVSDTGVGIPKEYLPFVFDKFRQVDSSETRLYGGVGMGLYIVKKFTELLGGTVEVESEVGKGSTFTVKLPCGQ